VNGESQCQISRLIQSMYKVEQVPSNWSILCIEVPMSLFSARPFVVLPLVCRSLLVDLCTVRKFTSLHPGVPSVSSHIRREPSSRRVCRCLSISSDALRVELSVPDVAVAACSSGRPRNSPKRYKYHFEFLDINHTFDIAPIAQW
jgi:hypothetical protein